MPDPLTSNKLLAAPTRGSDAGTWDTPMNGNSAALDGMLGGLGTIGLSSSNVTLSAPAGTVTPSAGPTQSQNAIIRFTGALTQSVVVTIPLPGIYVVENRCTNTNSFSVVLSNGGGGEVVGLPPGEAVDVFSDGTNIRFRNLGRIGEIIHMPVASVPVWINSCSVPPYLLCDGTIYNVANFPFLGAMLGATFGGNGGTTFGVQDLRGRVPVMLNLGTGRTTAALTGGLDGNTLGAQGGEGGHTSTTGETPSHSHGVQEPNGGLGHAHPAAAGNFLDTSNVSGIFATVQIASPGFGLPTASTTGFAVTGITIQATGGGGAHNNVQPGQTTGIWLVRAG